MPPFLTAGGSAYVERSRPTIPIIPPPVRNGGIASSSSLRPHRMPTPVRSDAPVPHRGRVCIRGALEADDTDHSATGEERGHRVEQLLAPPQDADARQI